MLCPSLSRANSAPVITFAPSLRVPVPIRGTLARTKTDSAGQISPTPLLPRPPRCLTPYPDTSNLPGSCDPSPLSSPAFSAYSMNHSSSVDASEGEGITDTDELEGRVTVDTNEEQEVMSPGARARADHARLLAPALHMSHLNSPTNVRFKLPLSPMPMRKLKLESAEQGVVSPIYRGPSPIPFLHVGGHEDNAKQGEDKKGNGQDRNGEGEVPVFAFSCDSPPSTAQAVGVWLDDQQKQKQKAVMGETVLEMKVGQGEEVRKEEMKTLSSQVLEVHIDTID